MSIALDRSSNRIEGSGFMHGMSCISIFESPELLTGDRRFPAGGEMAAKAEEREEELDSCSSSSSIGKNSDVSGMSSDQEDSGETEVQSSYKRPLDSMNALEEVLPLRRGISRFYNGKSKSFTSLADASTSASCKDLAKPENAYNRRRRNLLAYNHVLDKNRNFPLRSNGGGISKKLAATSRSTLALAVAMSSSDSNNSSEDLNSSLNCISRSPSLLLPPLHPQARLYHNNVSSSPPQRNLSAWRSYSLADLQQCATSGTTNATSSPISRGADDHSKANLSN
ncbi:hypothetical protein AAG906_002423 [Vitis piasezkii]|uniref:Uncharacterized protein n=2 Tax=Vitis vinifera TaxID=29760 RepID=A5B5R8_VITVI|nr:protein OXIDATIVE STRESS 3 LIKE 2 [Vitis vinifera]WJZ84937.1 hypothetical protein VitviT2T_004511 [Vitis vinifera]CAN82883.1 hypothetical protein VITISV_008557 [Vitis vinifera]|eukprot:XP_002281841.1 PREDICTED: uncharacterized protein LOC100260963 [Vitis vinifera]